jgi:hypothetical protein
MRITPYAHFLQSSVIPPYCDRLISPMIRMLRAKRVPNTVLSTLISESLEVVFDNLDMASAILDCAEEAAADLNPEIHQRLALVHVGLAMAMQALESEDLHELIARID